MRSYVEISECGTVVRCYDEPGELRPSSSLRLLDALLSLYKGNGHPVILTLAGAVLGACDGIDVDQMPFADGELVKKFKDAADKLLENGIEGTEEGEDFDRQ